MSGSRDVTQKKKGCEAAGHITTLQYNDLHVAF